MGKGQAEQTARFAGHEAYGLGGTTVCGEQEVGFVRAVVVIDQQNHLALAVVVNDVFYTIERHYQDLGVMVIRLQAWYTIIHIAAQIPFYMLSSIP